MNPPTPTTAARLGYLFAASTFVLGAACGDAELADDQSVVLESDPRTLVAREEFEAAEQDLAPEDLGTIDNDDGTWSYALPPGFDPEIRVQGKLLTWYYDGQAKYSRTPTQGAERTWIATESRVPDPEDQLMQMKRIDRLGRIWRVQDVDHEAWALRAAVAPEENEGDEPTAGTPLRSSTPEHVPGTAVKWKPMSWDHQSCVAGGGLNPNEAHFWDGDGRVAVTNASGRQGTAVNVRVNGANVCSGVIIRSDQVLTAAHCVSDDNNNPLVASTVSVVRAADGQVRTAGDVDFSASYGGGSGSGGGTDFNDDWAIIETTSGFSAGFETMDLSSATDSVLDALNGVHNLGYPQFFPECTATVPLASVLVHHKEMEPIASTLNKSLRFKIDGTPGHSGGPLYYCPTGDNDVCGAGDEGFVFAVFAGWNTTVDRFVGPKVPSFKVAATAFMDD